MGLTNSIPIPKPWLVNRIRQRKIIADISKLKKKTDFIIVCLHFGQQYRRVPNQKQKKLVHFLFKHGVNAILGAHPHVLQPVIFKKVKDLRGNVKNRVAAYSLGNFISTRLWKNNYTIRAMILQMTITKDRRGTTDILKIGRTPTIVRYRKIKGRTVFKIVPESPSK